MFAGLVGRCSVLQVLKGFAILVLVLCTIWASGIDTGRNRGVAMSIIQPAGTGSCRSVVDFGMLLMPQRGRRISVPLRGFAAVSAYSNLHPIYAMRLGLQVGCRAVAVLGSGVWVQNQIAQYLLAVLLS